MCHLLFVHSSLDGHLGYSNFLAIMKNAVVNICVQAHMWTCHNLSWLCTLKRNCWVIWQCRRPYFDSWIGKILWRRDRLPTPVFLGFPCGPAGKEYTCNVGDLGSIPGLGRSPGKGKGYPLQYPGLENSMDCIVHGVTKSWTLLSEFHFHFSWQLWASLF